MADPYDHSFCIRARDNLRVLYLRRPGYESDVRELEVTVALIENEINAAKNDLQRIVDRIAAVLQSGLGCAAGSSTDCANIASDLANEEVKFKIRLERLFGQLGRVKDDLVGKKRELADLHSEIDRTHRILSDRGCN